MLVEPIAPAVDTILIVDDDTARAARIGQALSLQGYGVLHACSGHAAVDLAREHRPPLVLLSVTTAQGDQADLCRQLQSDWRCGSPSIIILAGRADVAEFASGLATTADDYVILEPFDAVRVLTRVAATLRRAEEMRASSPLTGLPGNTAIETELQRRTALGEPMALLYIDLDNFKAYNDHYGFLRGDAVLRGVADVLRAAAEKRPGAFLGHVGGDDFVVVSSPEDAEDIANEITAGVDERAPFFYDPEDAARGGIDVVDRQGVPHHYPLVTVSVGVARTLEGQIGDHRALVDVATEMKQYAKTLKGSVAAMDRRADVDGGVGPRPPLLPRSQAACLSRHMFWRRRGQVGSGVSRVATIVPALLLALTLVGGSTATAFAASAAPGDPLYPARLKLESVRLTLATNPLRKVVLHLDFASLRLEELTQLLVTPDPDLGLVEVVKRDFQSHVEKAFEGLQLLKGKGDAEESKTAQIRIKAVTVEALSETVRTQCRTVEAQRSAATACKEIQSALPKVNEIALMVESEAPVVAIGPQSTAMGPPPPAPPSNGSSNTTTATAGQPPEASQASAESSKPAASKESSASGDKAAGSSGASSPKQASSPSEASPSPEPTPTPTEPAPTPTHTPTPTQGPPPPSADEQQGAPPDSSGPPGGPPGVPPGDPPGQARRTPDVE